MYFQFRNPIVYLAYRRVCYHTLIFERKCNELNKILETSNLHSIEAVEKNREAEYHYLIVARLMHRYPAIPKSMGLKVVEKSK